MLSTGITKLDENLGGGILEGSSVIFYSEPGVENLEFACQTMFANLLNKKKCLYFVNNKKPETVKEIMQQYGWDVSDFEKSGAFSFIDNYSCLIGLKANSELFIKDPSDIKEISEVVTAAIKKYKNSVLIFDALSSLLDMRDDSCSIIRYIQDWISLSKKSNTSLIFVFTEWPYNEDVIHQIRAMPDCIVELKALESNVILRKYFTISKINWDGKVKKNDVPFKIITPGGVRVYIPKILVAGPYHAGKSSFVHSASVKSVSVNRIGTTIALDFGHVDLGGFAVDLFGTPGQERFDPILKLLGGESFGVVLVVDSTDPNGFVRAKSMLEKTKTTGLPIVVAANKADLPGALSPAEIRSRMSLPKDIPIISVTAEDIKKARLGAPCRLNTEEVNSILMRLFKMVIS
jgi:small GTP-binding protein